MFKGRENMWLKESGMSNLRTLFPSIDLDKDKKNKKKHKAWTNQP